MTDEGKITCNGLGVIPSDRVRPTPRGWREGPLPSYERCPGCADCPPTAEQRAQASIAAIEGRVRAEVAEERQQLRRVAEVSHLFTGDDHWPDCPGCAINAILDVAGSERCGICGGHLTAGGCERHHDTTPEGRDG